MPRDPDRAACETTAYPMAPRRRAAPVATVAPGSGIGGEDEVVDRHGTARLHDDSECSAIEGAEHHQEAIAFVRELGDLLLGNGHAAAPQGTVTGCELFGIVGNRRPVAAAQALATVERRSAQV